MIVGLLGYKEVSKNSQNQIVLPAEFRDVFQESYKGSRYYVYMQEGRCLFLSTIEEIWRDLSNGGKKHLYDALDQDGISVLSTQVSIVNLGSDGRLTLTKAMLEKAGISKDEKKIICCGAINKVEIWSVERFKNRVVDREIEYTALKRKVEEEVFKSNFPPLISREDDLENEQTEEER